ncbi:Tat binding protein 1-interacting protein-domain-containing protein [Zopfochytrium polystomum]|nr:Tat binding protein 1-interacting protein-domain-containing protein [Zopfochytrium polystomum]
MPPKKTISKGKENGGDVAETILKYMKNQNRPYSATDVNLNLKNAIPKATVAKVLAQLLDQGLIHGKAYGKQWVYVAKQSPETNLSAEDAYALDKRLEDLSHEVEKMRETTNRLQHNLNQLNKALTVDELRARAASLQAEIADMEPRLEGLKAGTRVVSPEEKARVDKLLEQCRKEWRARKKLFKNAWDSITENVERPKELMEELGIETDESVGMDINRDPLDGLL